MDTMHSTSKSISCMSEVSSRTKIIDGLNIIKIKMSSEDVYVCLISNYEYHNNILRFILSACKLLRERTIIYLFIFLTQICTLKQYTSIRKIPFAKQLPFLDTTVSQYCTVRMWRTPHSTKCD